MAHKNTSILLQIFLLFLISNYTSAQNRYIFTHFNQSYQPLDTGVGIWQNEYWSYTVNNAKRSKKLGFNFTFWNNTDSVIYIRNNGTVAFMRSDNTGFLDNINICFADIKAQTNSAPWKSEIICKTEGISPNKVFKLEYNNVGFAKTDTTQFGNFQLWLYETTNVIEMRYGPSNTDSSAFFYNVGPYVGMDTLSASVYFLLAGDPLSPAFIKGDTQLLAMPPNGMVYKFTPDPNTGIRESENKQKTFVIYPNPVTSHIDVSKYLDPNNKVELYNVTGELVKSCNVYEPHISVSDLPNGYYSLVICSKNGILRSKFAINH